jgi:hypothetical protein
MDGHHLHLIASPEDAQKVQTRAARNARIDRIGVDRSCHDVYRGKALPAWSEEANRREPALATRRTELTLEQRLEAWRGIVALPKVTRTR